VYVCVYVIACVIEVVCGITSTGTRLSSFVQIITLHAGAKHLRVDN
jgi:hypothetical protein